MQQTHQTPGPLATPKAFRRPIGAHAVLVSLLLADLCGLLFWLFVGALLTPLLWWIIQRILPMLHVSLLLDVGIVLILWSLAHSIFGQLVLKKKAEEAWEHTGPLIIVTIVILLLIALLRTSWMAIPAPVPAISPQPIHGWPLQLSIIGGDVAAGLTVLTHFTLWRRDRRKTADKLLPLSRAHPGDTVPIDRASLYHLPPRPGPFRASTTATPQDAARILLLCAHSGRGRGAGPPGTRMLLGGWGTGHLPGVSQSGGGAGRDLAATDRPAPARLQ